MSWCACPAPQLRKAPEAHTDYGLPTDRRSQLLATEGPHARSL